MITSEVLDFLITLSKNNNRDWFESKKEIFKIHQAFTKEVFDLVQLGMSATDNLDKLKMYRIYRDVRFSKDKTPYKDYFSAALSRSGSALRGGYYIHLKPDAAFLAVGFWEPNKEDLFRIRKEIEQDASDFHAFLKGASFKKTWGSFSGETLKTSPKGFDKEHSEIELLRRKNFVFVKTLTNAEILSADFVGNTIKDFNHARPFLDLMSDILTTDINGQPFI